MSKIMLTINEASNEFSLPRYAIRQWLISGQLPHVKAGNRYLIAKANLERFLSGEMSVEKSLKDPKNVRFSQFV